MKPVCLVIGAGAGIGGTVGGKFASEGYHAVLCRRSNTEGLEELVAGIRQAGGDATGFLLNATEEGAIEGRISQLKQKSGPLKLSYLLGRAIGNRSLRTSFAIFELELADGNLRII